ncbi:hypothetical protein QR685DRAFT_488564 [Neurospora intermedia]|uniref:Uncharacterized protein n=1 Tax=Neurospora intermedia TaxID=5142 RepID=A0ABR3DRC0_NEUIN
MTTIPKPSVRKNSNRNASHPSHLPPTPPTLHPLPASLLLSQDPRLSRLLTHDRNDFFSTGCRELDSHVLLNAGLNGGGGFEGGCVVGLSCEEEETIGLAIGLQVVARMLLMSSSSSSSSSSLRSKAKAMIITTLSTTSLLPRLRLALVSEARVLQGNVGNVHDHQVDRGVIKSCLERVLVARVFDAEGLREVLRELEEVEQQQQTVVSHSGGGETGEKRTEQSKEGGLLPDLIMITNTSHLLNTLFTRNKTGSDRSAAHNSAVQLSDQIRLLSRRGPLVMMLNSTTSPTTTSSSSFNTTNSISMFDDDNNNRGPKQPDLSIMRSIFNPPPPLALLAPMEAAASGYIGGLVGGHSTAGAPSTASYRGPGGYGGGRGGGYGRYHDSSTHLHPHQTQTQAAARRNKPSYGMVFSQILDLHLLCTKVPRGRTRHHGGGAYGGGGGGGYGGYGGGYVWAVEVLLDELGVYEGLDVILDKVSREGGEEEEEEEKEGQREQQEERKGKRLTRRSREQRWGAVEIEEGSGRVVDAFR